MSQTIFLTNTREQENLRYQAVRGVLERRREAEGRNATTSSGSETGELLSAIGRLQDEGLLYREGRAEGGQQLVYVPSRAAKEQIFSTAPGGAWDEKVLKKQRNAFRSTSGALFRFPFEEQEGSLEAFITDWSPFPAAAALALHKDHPFAARAASGRGSYFTGRFVRHPLTGDLLPVWVASWVKPEFGTGVVVVNPAHSNADLAFAREVGLPVRFALVNAPVTGNPESWPTPPVIKSGRTTKTGEFDGLEPHEAVEKYFERLSEHGLAQKYVDRGIGGCPLAALTQHGAAEVSLCEQCGRVQDAGGSSSAACIRCGGACAPASLEAFGIMEAVSSMAWGGAVTLLCPASEVESTLLFARLLHYDLLGRPLALQKLYTLAGMEKPKAEPPPEVAPLAVLAAAPLGQVAVLKQPLVEQAQLFFNRHSELLRAYRDAPEWPANAGSGKLFARSKEQLADWNLQEAFSSLYAAQKQLVKEPEETLADLLPVYFTLTYVLAGYEHPERLRVADVWNSL